MVWFVLRYMWWHIGTLAERYCAIPRYARHICHRVRVVLGDSLNMTFIPLAQRLPQRLTGRAPSAESPAAQSSAAQSSAAQSPAVPSGGSSGTPEGRPLSVPRGAALYIGALLGPGLLLLPGLAAAEAGPASVLAWLGLLALSALFAVVFSALGRVHPQARGVADYTAAGLGSRAGAAAGWCFLAGVICGAPVVCLIGATYVTGLTGGGQVARCVVAAVLLLTVLGLALGGLRATTTAQLILVSLLAVVIVVAVAGSAPAARAGNWAPFAPHGWAAIGHAASTLMLSFVGWEAVAPLTGRFGEPGRQLPRVIGIAFGATSVIYLGLAIATIAVLGRGAATDVPLADLLVRAIGHYGRAIAAVAAVVLTLGATNAYLSGAAAMAVDLIRRPSGRGTPGRRASGLGAPGQGAPGQGAPGQGAPGRPAGRRSTRPFLAFIAVAGIVLIGLYAVRLVTTEELVGLPTTLFLSVYLGCTASAARTLGGRTRYAAVAALLAVAVVLAFSGWALLVAAAVALVAGLASRKVVASVTAVAPVTVAAAPVTAVAPASAGVLGPAPAAAPAVAPAVAGNHGPATDSVRAPRHYVGEGPGLPGSETGTLEIACSCWSGSGSRSRAGSPRWQGCTDSTARGGCATPACEPGAWRSGHRYRPSSMTAPAARC
jgi:amino acid efflux transporter